MFPVFETIKIQDGIPRNLDLHQERIEISCRKFFGKKPSFDLRVIFKTSYEPLLNVETRFIASDHNTSINPKNAKIRISTNNSQVVPNEFRAGVVKCRFLYDAEKYEIQFAHYRPLEINTFKVIEADAIEYSLKYTNRCTFNYLLAEKGDCDEVIIVKNGKVTDCTFANLVFFDGLRYLTPDTPLLKGTKRKQLLNEGLIEETTIFKEDLLKFEGICLINAMLDLEMPPKKKRVIM
jgi:4-amino-4-deoxychorismate lyase